VSGGCLRVSRKNLGHSAVERLLVPFSFLFPFGVLFWGFTLLKPGRFRPRTHETVKRRHCDELPFLFPLFPPVSFPLLPSLRPPAGLIGSLREASSSLVPMPNLPRSVGPLPPVLLPLPLFVSLPALVLINLRLLFPHLRAKDSTPLLKTPIPSPPLILPPLLYFTFPPRFLRDLWRSPYLCGIFPFMCLVVRSVVYDLFTSVFTDSRWSLVGPHRLTVYPNWTP